MTLMAGAKLNSTSPKAVKFLNLSDSSILRFLRLCQHRDEHYARAGFATTADGFRSGRETHLTFFFGTLDLQNNSPRNRLPAASRFFVTSAGWSGLPDTRILTSLPAA